MHIPIHEVWNGIWVSVSNKLPGDAADAGSWTTLSVAKV